MSKLAYAEIECSFFCANTDGQQWTFFDLEVREQVRQAKKVCTSLPTYLPPLHKPDSLCPSNQVYHQMKGGVCGIKVPDLAYALRCVGIDLSDHHVQSIFPHLYGTSVDSLLPMFLKYTIDVMLPSLFHHLILCLVFFFD